MRNILTFSFLLFTFYFLLFTFPSTVFADPPTTPASGSTPAGGTTTATAPWNAQNQSNFTSQTLQHSLLCDLAGISPLGKCVGFQRDPKAGDPDHVKLSLFKELPTGGALGQVTSVMTAMYYPPTSTVQYLADVAKGFGLIEPVHAQVTGSGAGIINPVVKLWEAVRNITYIIFILIFLAVGFMIMFRQKLNAQTVLSVQAALPGLVIGLLLVYLSYFISAAIIDVSFFGIPLVGQVFYDSKAPNAYGNTREDFQKVANDSNLFSMFMSAYKPGDTFLAVRDTVSKAYGYTTFGGTGGIQETIGRVMHGLTVGFSTALVSGPLGIVAGLATFAGPEIIGLLVPIILLIALFIQFFKLVFKMIMSYVMLLVTTILGPLFIMIGSVPGKGSTMGFWWKNLLGHALVFPSVFAVFLFAGMILASGDTEWKSSPPLFGGLPISVLRLLIAYGIILGSPAVPDLVKKMVGAQDLGEIGQTGARGFMAGFGVGRGAGTAGFNKLFAPTQRLRNEYRTLLEQQALGKILPGSASEARLNALSAGLVRPRWLPQDVQKWLMQTGNKPFSGKS